MYKNILCNNKWKSKKERDNKSSLTRKNGIKERNCKKKQRERKY
jgi:hypothetical protein